MKRAAGENISGVTYRCKECGANLGDPEIPNYYVWASQVRVHMIQKHYYSSNVELLKNKPLNDLVAAFFVWTTPTGQEVVTTSK